LFYKKLFVENDEKKKCSNIFKINYLSEFAADDNSNDTSNCISIKDSIDG